MTGIDEFLFGVIESLIANIISFFFKKNNLTFLKKKYIKSRINSALTKIVEPLIPFFTKEGISEQKQHLLIETCKRELTPLVETPEFFFKGSLDGEKIFTGKYSDGKLPQEIHDEGLESVYGLLFPRIAEILCRIPEILEDWEMRTITAEILHDLHISISTDTVLNCLRERTGLIIGPDTWEFTHNTITEYLVAETVHEGDKHDDKGNRIDRLYLLDQHGNDHWNIITFLWAGLTTVNELEDFIEKCLEKDDWQLGYGLLYDQYERVTKEAKRKWMLGLVKRISKMNRRFVFTDSCIPAFGPEKYLHNISGSPGILYFPDYKLRGILGIDVVDIIKKALKQNSLFIDDLQIMNKKNFYFFLFGLGWNEERLQIIENILIILYKDQAHFILIFNYIIFTIRYSIKNKKTAFLKSFKTYIDKTYPDYKSLWKLLYMSSLSYMFSYNHQKIKETLELYLSTNSSVLTDIWLTYTKEWVIMSDPVDLLFVCRSHLSEAIQKKLEPCELYKKALASVETLIKRRDSIKQC